MIITERIVNNLNLSQLDAAVVQTRIKQYVWPNPRTCMSSEPTWSYLDICATRKNQWLVDISARSRTLRETAV